MAKEFLGFKQVKGGELSSVTFQDGFIYFVREDETKEHGYLYFNGKKYGTTKDVADRIAALEAVSADSRSRISILEGKVASAETDIDTLEIHVASAETKIAVLEARATSAETRITALENAQKSADTKYEELEKRVSSAETDINALEGRATSAETRLATAEADIDALEARATSAETRIKTIEDDYLTEADKTQLAEAISATTVTDFEYVKSGDAKDLVITLGSGKEFKVDAKEFVIDGMLSSVTYDATAHTMTFIWNTDAGGKSITINLDDIISPYNADEETITLDRTTNTFSAKVADISLTDSGFSADTTTSLVQAGDLVSALNEYGKKVDAAFAEEEKLIESANTRIDGVVSAVSELQNYVQSADTEIRSEIKAEQEARISADTELKEAIEALDKDAVKNIEVNGVKGSVSANTASVTIDASDVKLGQKLEYSGTTLADTANTVDEALAAVVGQMVDNEKVTAAALNDLEDKISAETEERKAAIEALDADVEGEDDGIKVEVSQVNGKLSAVTVTADIKANKVTLANAVSGQPADTDVETVLGDIYNQIASASTSAQIESSDSSITINDVTEGGKDIVVNKEVATADTVEAGHAVELKQNDSGALYGVLWVSGDDID